MAPKPAPRPHAAKNRVGALGLNGCLKPAAGALAHRARLRGELARWVRQTGEAGLSLIPKQSTNRFGNQSIGNGSAIAARRRMAEKRSERLISLCSLRARQRVDVPKRPQSWRSHQLQPPCLGSSKKNNPDASKAAGKAFLLIFRHIREKDADVDGFNASQRFPFLFFRQAASEADHLFDNQTMRKKRAKARDCKHCWPKRFFQGLSPAHGPNRPARLRAPSPKSAPYTTIARFFFCACDGKPTQARQRQKACKKIPRHV